MYRDPELGDDDTDIYYGIYSGSVSSISSKVINFLKLKTGAMMIMPVHDGMRIQSVRADYLATEGVSFTNLSLETGVHAYRNLLSLEEPSFQPTEHFNIVEQSFGAIALNTHRSSLAFPREKYGGASIGEIFADGSFDDWEAMGRQKILVARLIWPGADIPSAAHLRITVTWS